MTFGIDQFKRKQDIFNLISGTANKTSKEDLENQARLIEEEFKEYVDGLSASDKVEQLDAVIDLGFVVLGLLQKYEMMGYLTDEAMRRVADNNLIKFPKNEETAIATVEYYKQQGVDCKYEYNEVYDCYVIRDSNNKVRKPLGYVSVDLSDCVPKE